MAEAHGYSSPGKDEWNAPNEQKALSNAQNWLKCRSFSENVAQDKSAVCVMLALQYFKICIHMTIALSR